MVSRPDDWIDAKSDPRKRFSFTSPELPTSRFSSCNVRNEISMVEYNFMIGRDFLDFSKETLTLLFMDRKVLSSYDRGEEMITNTRNGLFTGVFSVYTRRYGQT